MLRLCSVYLDCFQIRDADLQTLRACSSMRIEFVRNIASDVVILICVSRAVGGRGDQRG